MKVLFYLVLLVTLISTLDADDATDAADDGDKDSYDEVIYSYSSEVVSYPGTKEEVIIYGNGAGNKKQKKVPKQKTKGGEVETFYIPGTKTEKQTKQKSDKVETFYIPGFETATQPPTTQPPTKPPQIETFYIPGFETATQPPATQPPTTAAPQVQFVQAVTQAPAPKVQFVNPEVPKPIPGPAVEFINPTPAVEFIDPKFQPTDLKPFASFVFQLISPHLFNKAFDPNLSPEQVNDAIFQGSLLYSQYLGLPCYEEGAIPLQTGEAVERAFRRGTTPLLYYSTYLDDMEDYLIKKGIMSPCNVQLLGYRFYEILRDTFKSIDLSISPAARLYHLVYSIAKFLGTFGVMPHQDQIYTMNKFIDNNNRI